MAKYASCDNEPEDHPTVSRPNRALLTHLLLDLESTGLHPVDDDILEVAAIGLSAAAEELFAYTVVIRPGPDMHTKLGANPVVLEMHAASGLYNELLDTDPQILPTLASVEEDLLALLDEYADPGGTVTLAGSGVSHYDKLAIAAQMPRLNKRLTYHSLEIGTFRRRFEQVTGKQLAPQRAEKSHRAEDDIRDDLRVLRAADAVFRNSAMAPRLQTASERAMAALSLVEAFNEYDEISTADGVMYNAGARDALTDITSHTSAADLILGLTTLARSLTAELADALDVPAELVLATTRNKFLLDQHVSRS